MFGFSFLSQKNKDQQSAGQEELDPQTQHQQEREQFQEVLQSFNASRIEDRLVVLDILLSVEEHLTLTGLEGIIKEKRPDLLDREFLKETMEMFCQFGFAQKQLFETQEAVYEHHHLGMHHDHFICTRCGKIQEFANNDLEKLQHEIARQFQFHPLQHKMEIYGLCASCMAQREPALSLQYAANGEQVRIVTILGGREVQARLNDMGLTVGACLEIVSNHSSGPLIVAIKGTRLAINAGLAKKIMVAHVCRHDAAS
ncbi:MAG: Fur family transcriptional regulator [Desulfurivibrio sp.]|nr:Fur family transcriptional regulator [Desulfurivibrio sp.]